MDVRHALSMNMRSQGDGRKGVAYDSSSCITWIGRKSSVGLNGLSGCGRQLGVETAGNRTRCAFG